MNACTHFNQKSCVRAPLRPSEGTCALCSSFVDSGKPRGAVAVTVKRRPVDPGFVMICLGKHLQWTVAAWERIAACELVGTQYKVPRALYEELKDLRT